MSQLILPPDHSAYTTESELVEIDWRYIQTKKVDGEITMMLTWNFGADSPDAVMLLAPTYGDGKAKDAPTICIIARNDAWKWNRTTNGDSEMVGMGEANISSDEWQKLNAAYYCMQLGLDPDLGNQINRVRSVIENNLADLINLPPAPDRDEMKTATFTVTNTSTGEVEEHDVRLS